MDVKWQWGMLLDWEEGSTRVGRKEALGLGRVALGLGEALWFGEGKLWAWEEEAPKLGGGGFRGCALGLGGRSSGRLHE